MAEPNDQLDKVALDAPIVTKPGKSADGGFVTFRSMRRQIIAKTGAATLTDQECEFSLVTIDTAALITLPAVSAANAGADVIIASKDGAAATVDIVASADFGNGGATADLITFAAGQSAHFVNDGTYWYVITPATLS